MPESNACGELRSLVECVYLTRFRCPCHLFPLFIPLWDVIVCALAVQWQSKIKLKGKKNSTDKSTCMSKFVSFTLVQRNAYWIAGIQVIVEFRSVAFCCSISLVTCYSSDSHSNNNNKRMSLDRQYELIQWRCEYGWWCGDRLRRSRFDYFLHTQIQCLGPTTSHTAQRERWAQFRVFNILYWHYDIQRTHATKTHSIQ